MKNYFILLICLCFGTYAAAFQYSYKAPQKGKGSRAYEAWRLPVHLLNLSTHKAKKITIDEVAYGDHKRQYLLVCKSKTVPAYRDKVIFFIHGGGWRIGKPEHHVLMAEFLAENGYLVIMPSYRHTPEVSYAEIRADISTSLKKAAEILTEQELCDKDIVVGGVSAGGNLAALLVYDDMKLANLGIDIPTIKGFFAIAGALDLATMTHSKILETYAGKRDSPQFKEANPVNHLKSNIQIPVLCIHGDQDGLVDVNVARSFIAKICNINCDLVEFHTIEGGTHLAVGTQWYYQKKKDAGQREVILDWLERL